MANEAPITVAYWSIRGLGEYDDDDDDGLKILFLYFY
jgi:hypothetical protein